jgi:uncharacterized membrane protein
MTYDDLVVAAVKVAEAVGALGMLGGAAAVLLGNARAVFTRRMDTASYQRLRRDLGRVILVGLEILIVADIVNTVVVATTLTSVAVLGGVVLIRTALSFSLDIEIDGVLPWRAADARTGAPGDH